MRGPSEKAIRNKGTTIQTARSDSVNSADISTGNRVATLPHPTDEKKAVQGF
jgi:hypothetical protein